MEHRNQRNRCYYYPLAWLLQPSSLSLLLPLLAQFGSVVEEVELVLLQVSLASSLDSGRLLEEQLPPISSALPLLLSFPFPSPFICSGFPLNTNFLQSSSYTCRELIFLHHTNQCCSSSYLRSSNRCPALHTYLHQNHFCNLFHHSLSRYCYFRNRHTSLSWSIRQVSL